MYTNKNASKNLDARMVLRILNSVLLCDSAANKLTSTMFTVLRDFSSGDEFFRLCIRMNVAPEAYHSRGKGL